MGLLTIDVVTIEGADPCPGAAAVQAQLGALLPDGTAAPRRVTLTRVDGALDVAIAVDGNARSFHRRLPRLRSCAEEATVAATVIAAWQGQAGSALLPVPAARAAAPRRAVDAEVDAAFVGALAGSAFAPGATVEARLAPRGARVGAWLGLLGEGTRELALGNGRAAWGRSALRAGAGYRLARGRLRFDARAEALLALLYLQGLGFAESYRRYDADVGLGAGARVGVQTGPVRPFVALDVAGWLRREQAVAQQPGGDSTIDVPRFEVLLAVGIAVAGRP
jgi:hypothetical protein